MVWKNVQGLRGIAALLVVFAHVHDFSDRVAYQPLFRMFAPLGACGVDLFFVISGFIMMTVHWHDFNALDSSRRFLLRRWLRVLPPYWVVTLMLALVFAVAPSLRHHWSGAHANLLLSLLLVPQPDTASIHDIVPPLLFVGWTLIYEMYFYYAFAGALRMSRGAALRCFALWGVAVLAFQFVPLTLVNPYMAFFGRNLIIEFLFGIGVGYLVMNGRYYAPSAFIGLGFVTLVAADVALMAAFHGAWGDYDGLRFLMWGLPMASILYAAISFEKRGILLPTSLQITGNASYSIYLWHAPLFVAIGKALLPLSHRAHLPALPLAIAIPVVVVGVALQLYRYIEVPVTAFSRTFATKTFPSLMKARNSMAKPVPGSSTATAYSGT